MQVPKFIRNHTNIQDAKMWHFYVVLAGWATIYTTMNVSVVLFLNEILGSIFLAGLALAVGSFFSMIFDGIFSSFQKIFSARSLFLTSIVGMILAVLLFLISNSILLAFLAAIFFRVTFDLCDITAVSYVLSKSVPQQYGQNLSYKQLAQGIGMILGLLVSAILLAASYFIGDATIATLNGAASLVNRETQSESFISALFIMKILLLMFLFCLWLFAFILFDKNTEKIGKNEIRESMKAMKENTIESLHIRKSKNDATDSSQQERKRITVGGMFGELTDSAKDFFLIFRQKPGEISLIWSMGVMGIFSYWDTFLGTFLPIFFTEVLRKQSGWLHDIPGSILMFVFIVPVLGLLPLVAKLGDKFGRQYFMVAGIAITAISTFVAGFVSMKAIFILIVAGFGIAFGYLFGMSSAKAQTALKLNEFFAKMKNQKEIDTNASSGSMMLVDNIGNIVGPVLGGFIIEVMGFQGFFLLFSFLLMALLAYTGWKQSRIL